ncbi:hypothetical protein [Sinomonas sp. ASV322]|uniref:hypothetical protein n=1 Tax=Sinomonas sp. ASV322 TaxID=3041920 RepID=UPI0027DC4DC0|nr:hypothetical protein [Sinomonas sp. ASV322]MDQ4504301.1 hypothetical protein [Sinomonas sp. ASV322]
MVAGIAVLGVMTASIASWLVESVSAETAARTSKQVGAVIEGFEEPLEDQIRSLSEQVARLTAVLEARGSGRS